MECEGLVIRQRGAASGAPASQPPDAPVDTDGEGTCEQFSVGRLYMGKLRPFKDRWRSERDAADNRLWQSKMSFADFMSNVVWPALDESARRELLEGERVQFYSVDERRRFVVERCDAHGRLLDALGAPLAEGLQMFVLSAEDNVLYVASKIRGVRHHTSFVGAAEVSAAGMLLLGADGRLLAIIARSGHYNPSSRSLLNCVAKLMQLGAHLEGVVLQYQPRVEDEADTLVEIDHQPRALPFAERLRRTMQAERAAARTSSAQTPAPTPTATSLAAVLPPLRLTRANVKLDHAPLAAARAPSLHVASRRAKSKAGSNTSSKMTSYV